MNGRVGGTLGMRGKRESRDRGGGENLSFEDKGGETRKKSTAVFRI